VKVFGQKSPVLRGFERGFSGPGRGPAGLPGLDKDHHGIITTVIESIIKDHRIDSIIITFVTAVRRWPEGTGARRLCGQAEEDERP
jgi:hypothetical protein